MAYRVGVWRSLVAHLHGVQGVEGSNPFTPTKELERAVLKTALFFVWMIYLNNVSEWILKLDTNAV